MMAKGAKAFMTHIECWKRVITMRTAMNREPKCGRYLTGGMRGFWGANCETGRIFMPVF
jgi:hypothetical protein